ncbi:MAG TPA: substrate-binding domain-containing protein [Gemmataceae bacterium]|nr:substrate-binding domain-containing protein [Gemmataceae bacterium]
MRRLSVLSTLLVPLLTLVALVGCGSTGGTEKSGSGPGAGKRLPGVGDDQGGETKRIIILTNGESPFWDAARQGLEAAKKDFKLAEAGLDAALEVNDGTEEGQLERLRQYASQPDIVAVGVSVTKEDNAAIARQLREMKEKGTYIITVDSDVNRSRFRDSRIAYVGTDNVEGGRELGRCAKLLRPEGGEYVTFVGFTSAQNAKERVQGFAEGAGDKFVQKDNMGDEIDRTRARDNVRTAFTNHPKLNTLVGIWSYNAPAIVGVVEAEKKAEREAKAFSIVTFDAEPGAIKKMAEGWIDAMVVQNPYQMGYQGIRLMNALVRKDQKTVDEMLVGKSKEGDLVDTGIKVVVPDSGSPLKPETFTNKEKKIEGYKLSDFQKWLQEFNLTGS